MTGARGLCILLAALVTLGLWSPPAQANEDIEQAGDIVQILIPVTGAVVAIAKKDFEGGKMYGKALLTDFLAVHTIKIAGSKTRPDGSDQKSFPSGHTNAAFSGATFLNTRYGPAWGIPSFAAAAFVGFSRVQADRHFADDVLAGASVAFFSNWLWVTGPYEQPSKVALQPISSQSGYGFSLTFTDGGGGKTAPKADFQARGRYEFEFGYSFTGNMSVQSPASTGTPFDLSNFATANEGQLTAQGNLEFFLGQNELMFSFAPFEVRDAGAFGAPVTFNGTVFAANTTTVSQYLNYDYRITWRYNLTPDSRWSIMPGIALSAQDYKISLLQGTLFQTVEGLIVYPTPYIRVAVDLSRHFRVILDADFIEWSGNRNFDVALFLRWRIDGHWDLGIGYRYFDHRVNDPAVRTQLEQGRAVLALGYAW